ncbi:hypothetical protein F511_29226 [Dorcoceras hygrometricum]|uniref:CCHC-type domain-containing protein n=1 Tax=Dorcoceras hygrometricum TaxID=472368 RepID=A0A2Z7DI65_9LAMI|nr:hypothetical protein F511_29226 [Dorcoceras hygrometricum]
MNDEAQADQFINGLNPDVFTLVNTGRPNTFADALNRAKGAEAGLLRQRRAQFVPAAAKAAENPQIPPPPRFDAGSSSSGKKKNFFKGKGKQFKRSGTSSSSSSSEFKQMQPGPQAGDYCTRCGGKHATEQCRGVSGLCRICNQPGHFARICPHVILGISRIQQQQEQCQHPKGLLYNLINLKTRNKVDKEEARQ